MFESMLIKFHPVLRSFTANFTIVRRRFRCVLLQYVFLTIFLRCKVQFTFAAFHPFLFLVHQSNVGVEFTAFEKSFFTVTAVKRFLVGVFSFEVRRQM